MSEAVDNLDAWAEATAHDQLPHHETLVRLYELCDRYGGTSATRLVTSASDRHREQTGHLLAFGCCTTEDSIMAALRREERRLLRQVERGQASPL